MWRDDDAIFNFIIGRQPGTRDWKCVVVLCAVGPGIAVPLQYLEQRHVSQRTGQIKNFLRMASRSQFSSLSIEFVMSFAVSMATGVSMKSFLGHSSSSALSIWKSWSGTCWTKGWIRLRGLASADVYRTDTLPSDDVIDWIPHHNNSISNKFFSSKFRKPRIGIELTSQPSIQSCELSTEPCRWILNFQRRRTFPSAQQSCRENLFKFLLCKRVLCVNRTLALGKVFAQTSPQTADLFVRSAFWQKRAWWKKCFW